MNLTDVARARRWTIPNPSPGGDSLAIAGWEFGGDSAADKPIVLLHHANGMCAATWALVAAGLVDEFHLFAIDARGHGDSSHLCVPDDYQWDYFVSDLIHVAEQVLVETDRDSIALGVGSSFGGIVTARAQAKHGALFERIVMLDPPVHPRADIVAAMGLDMEPESSEQRETLVAQTLRRRSTWSSREEARAAWQHKPLFAAWDPAGFDLYLAEGLGDLADGQVALKCDPAVEAHIFGTTESLAVLDYGPRVQVPVHMVHAALGFFPADFFRIVIGLFPQGEFVQLPGGHLLPLEIPREVTQYLLTLIER